MVKKRNSVLLTSAVLWVLSFSCTDPLAQRESEVAQLRLDSIALANQQADLMEEYLNDSKYSGIAVNTTEDGLKYLILDEGDGLRFPQVNDIVSMHYTARFLSDSIFDTSEEQLAITTDSLYYASNGINVGAVMVALELDVKEAMTHLHGSNDGRAFPIFLGARRFEAMHYNQTQDGTGILSMSQDIFGPYIPLNLLGFRDGLNLVTPGLSVGGRGMILIPSALAYGTSGSAGGPIPANTVVIYEFTLNQIRP